MRLRATQYHQRPLSLGYACVCTRLNIITPSYGLATQESTMPEQKQPSSLLYIIYMCLIVVVGGGLGIWQRDNPLF